MFRLPLKTTFVVDFSSVSQFMKCFIRVSKCEIIMKFARYYLLVLYNLFSWFSSLGDFLTTHLPAAAMFSTHSSQLSHFFGLAQHVISQLVFVGLLFREIMAMFPGETLPVVSWQKL